MSKTKLKIAVVGYGRIGKRHVKHILNKGELVAIVDINQNEIDIETCTYSSVEDLIKANLEIDLISICTPNGTHSSIAIDLLNSGYNVLVEKPMALSASDAGKMIVAAEKANKRLFIVKQNRFNPPVDYLKNLIITGALGKLLSTSLNCYWNRNEDYYLNSWKGTLDLDGGTLYTQFSHFIDLLYWLFGDFGDFKGFSGNFLHKDQIEFEDSGVICFRYKEGALGTINYTVNSFQSNMEGSLTAFFENGTIKIGGKYLNELEYHSVKGIERPELAKGNNPNNYGNYVGSMSNHDLVYDNIIEVLQNNKEIKTNQFEGYKVVEIIESIYKSIR